MQRITSTQKMITEFEVISVTFFSQQKIKPTYVIDILTWVSHLKKGYRGVHTINVWWLNIE